jgi:hypothetical protein
LEPAASIIRLFGGEAKIAVIADVSYTAPYRWEAPIKRGGTGGIIPQRYHPALLKQARRQQLALKAEDFLPIR